MVLNATVIRRSPRIATSALRRVSIVPNRSGHCLRQSNFPRFFRAHHFLTRYRAPRRALRITRRSEGEVKKSAATKESSRGWNGARGRGSRHTRLSKFRKKHLPFPCISRLAAAPTLHRALFNGRFFALFGRLINRGASRLYFAPVLRLHRRTVARCSRGWDARRERRARRGGASPGGWSGVEESGARAGGRAVASLHNEQDAGTPRPPFCLHRNPPCLPVGASLARPHPRPFVLSRAATTPQLHPSSTYYFSVLRYVALRYVPRRCSRLGGTAKMMIPSPRNKSARSPRGRPRRPHAGFRFLDRMALSDSHLTSI